MDAEFAARAAEILRDSTSGAVRTPGIVAMARNREGVFFSGAAGVRRMGAPAPMTADTVFALYSCTKALTATAALRLVEEGRLDLDAPAKLYTPDIGRLQVLDGFDPAGAPMLRPPRRDVTIRMLMLHTAGFGYDFASAAVKRMQEEHGLPNHRGATRAGFMAPLLFDPGERWEYGLSLDWLGMAVEAAEGERLDRVLQARVLAPLGMRETAHDLTPGMASRRATVHQRRADGGLDPSDAPPRAHAEVYTGGGGMYGTVGDYMRFLGLWLNEGQGEQERVLRPETVAMAARDQLAPLKTRPLPTVKPALSHDVDLFPGLSKSWGFSFMINDEPAPTGRPAGSAGWAGLGNLYYWFDRRNGLAGFWATQIFPFLDPVSLNGSLAFESALYQALERSAPGVAA